MNNQDHTCFTCEKLFHTRDELVSHLSSHYESKSFSCDVCDEAFVFEDNLIEHLMSNHHHHENSKKRREKMCADKNSFSYKKRKNVFDAFKERNWHKKKLKSSKVYFSNSVKNKNSVNTDDILLSVDMKSIAHECMVCEKKFMKRAKLAQHLKRHDYSSKSICTICNKTFSDQYILKDHMVLHSGVKPYECEFCDMAFAWKPSLIVHRRKHTGEKPYLCNQCEWAFPTNTHLKRHVAEVHSTEKPFQCDVCGKAFSVKGRLREHMKNHGDSPTLQSLIKLGYSLPILNR